jgi:hypothetical protein
MCACLGAKKSAAICYSFSATLETMGCSFVARQRKRKEAPGFAIVLGVKGKKHMEN